jgi:hypothetical protein
MFGGRFAKAFALEGKPVGVVYEPIEDGIGNGWIADDLVPMLDWKLTCDHGRTAAMAVFHDLQEITSLL